MRLISSQLILQPVNIHGFLGLFMRILLFFALDSFQLFTEVVPLFSNYSVYFFETLCVIQICDFKSFFQSYLFFDFLLL